MSSHNLATTSTTVTPSVPYPDTGLSVRDILTHPPTLPSLHELLSFPRVPYLYLSLDRISATPYYYLYTFLPNLSRHLLLTLWFDPSMPASRPGHSWRLPHAVFYLYLSDLTKSLAKAWQSVSMMPTWRIYICLSRAPRWHTIHAW